LTTASPTPADGSPSWTCLRRSGPTSIPGGITLPDALELAKLARMPERLEAARKPGALYGTIPAAVARELQE